VVTKVKQPRRSAQPDTIETVRADFDSFLKPKKLTTLAIRINRWLRLHGRAQVLDADDASSMPSCARRLSCHYDLKSIDARATAGPMSHHCLTVLPRSVVA
jgi:hypothetical protein